MPTQTKPQASGFPPQCPCPHIEPVVGSVLCAFVAICLPGLSHYCPQAVGPLSACTVTPGACWLLPSLLLPAGRACPHGHWCSPAHPAGPLGLRVCSVCPALQCVLMSPSSRTHPFLGLLPSMMVQPVTPGPSALAQPRLLSREPRHGGLCTSPHCCRCLPCLRRSCRQLSPRSTAPRLPACGAGLGEHASAMAQGHHAPGLCLARVRMRSAALSGGLPGASCSDSAVLAHLCRSPGPLQLQPFWGLDFLLPVLV